jgi:hypothetical protein
MSSHSKRILAWAVLSGGAPIVGLGLSEATAAAQPAPMVCQDGATVPSPTEHPGDRFLDHRRVSAAEATIAAMHSHLDLPAR